MTAWGVRGRLAIGAATLCVVVAAVVAVVLLTGGDEKKRQAHPSAARISEAFQKRTGQSLGVERDDKRGLDVLTVEDTTTSGGDFTAAGRRFSDLYGSFVIFLRRPGAKASVPEGTGRGPSGVTWKKQESPSPSVEGSNYSAIKHYDDAVLQWFAGSSKRLDKRFRRVDAIMAELVGGRRANPALFRAPPGEKVVDAVGARIRRRLGRDAHVPAKVLTSDDAWDTIGFHAKASSRLGERLADRYGFFTIYVTRTESAQQILTSAREDDSPGTATHGPYVHFGADGIGFRRNGGSYSALKRYGPDHIVLLVWSAGGKPKVDRAFRRLDRLLSGIEGGRR